MGPNISCRALVRAVKSVLQDLTTFPKFFDQKQCLAIEPESHECKGNLDSLSGF